MVGEQAGGARSRLLDRDGRGGVGHAVRAPLRRGALHARDPPPQPGRGRGGRAGARARPKDERQIESCFAVLDRTLVLGASTHALFGVASACLLKAFYAPAAKKSLAEATVMSEYPDDREQRTPPVFLKVFLLLVLLS